MTGPLKRRETLKGALLDIAAALNVRADERNTVEEIKRRCVAQAEHFSQVAWDARMKRAESTPAPVLRLLGRLTLE